MEFMQPRSEEFRAHAAECEELAKQYGGLIKEQYEQLAGQWLFLAELAETSNRRCRSRWGIALRATNQQRPLKRATEDYGLPMSNGL
jgi:hypothetical protein